MGAVLSEFPTIPTGTPRKDARRACDFIFDGYWNIQKLKAFFEQANVHEIVKMVSVVGVYWV